MKFAQNFFTPKNPKKLIGNARPFYRSQWELKVMNLLDSHPNVINWASESVQIPYKNPLTGKFTVYIPDFLIMYKDKFGKQRTELVEVKPKREAFAENAKSKKDKAILLVNSAKWKAAMVWCAKNGMTFRVLTEDQIFVSKGANIKRNRGNS